MDKHTVFVKTDAGREALAQRAPGLLPRLRSLLIMVDGQRPAAAFDAASGGAEGAALPLLEQLLAQGWVRALEPERQPDAPPRPVPESAPAPGASDALAAWPLPDARRRVARFINDQLGPMGEAMALKVEACRQEADLRALVPRIREALLNYRNSATVARFDADIAPYLPTA
ncbi:hypothetical protein [Hydrogenophaga sp.]|jgi:hypothetical protein|uniref:hypothetical protein n=1 Tax=Hydrogenophaga sp. TaxID=1904254 RepID=UPI00391ACB6F